MKRYYKLVSVFILLGLFVSGLYGCDGCFKETTSPYVVILFPTNNSTVSGIITIQVKVNSNSDITKVEFYVDDTKLGEDLLSPYQYDWDTSGLRHNSTHTIKVKAIDSSGNIGEASTSVIISVEWTILMYLDGHNNLAPYLQGELGYLNNLTSTAGINVLILAGLNQSNPLSYLYYLHNGDFQVLNQGNYNFGDPKCLQNFLIYGVQNFPAKRYMVLLFDHGSGWRRNLDVSITKDICWDDIYNSSITIPELKSALQAMVSLIGRKIDLLYLDACVMGTVEVDYQLKDTVSYLVSSEAIAWIGGSKRWYKTLNQLTSNPSMSPSELGILFAQSYFNSYPSMPRTIAVKDLSKMDEIASSIYNFSRYLRECLDTYANTLISLRNQTESFSPYLNTEEEYIELYQYAELVAGNINYSNLQNSAINLTNIITASTIYCNYSGYSSAKGYSIWFPEDSASYGDGYNKYSVLDFTQDYRGREWLLFLSDIESL